MIPPLNGERDGQACAEKHRIGEPGYGNLVATADKGIAYAGKLPLFGRPDYRTPLFIGKRQEFLRGPVCHSSKLRNLPEDHGW